MLALDEVTFSYDDGPLILDKLSHEFSQGHLTGVAGPSGSGKSTVLYLLGLLLTPDSGTVRFASSSASKLSDRERSNLRARHIGFVFQDASLDPTRSILDNILEGALYAGLGRTSAIEEADRLLDEFGVDLPRHRVPGQISGGQAQRIGLCRALIKGPSVIVADEPTGNLDADSAEVVMTSLRGAAEAGAAVVVSTHDAAVLSECDDVIEL